MKIIAYYLPQFHEIPENNEMWGKGFTEWTNVKKGKPMFEGHDQPFIPLNNNYYDLTDVKVMEWQADLARKYGIYGFCFYHYWYNGHIIMNKPIENWLHDENIDFPYCICWANHQWTTSWSEGETKVIYEQKYNDKKEWKEHFDYLFPYFNDSRYIKTNGKPLVVLYEAANIPELNEMLDYWVLLAKENGLLGLEFAYQNVIADTIPSFDDSRFAYDLEYQPQYARVFHDSKRISKEKMTGFFRWLNWKTFKIKTPKFLQKHIQTTINSFIKLDYDDIWTRIIKMSPISKKSIPGAFIKFDSTARRGDRGMIIHGMTLQKFKDYLIKQIIHAKKEYKQDMLFMFAWNEWAEGGYLEPDEEFKYGVLESIRDALLETGEMPSGYSI